MGFHLFYIVSLLCVIGLIGVAVVFLHLALRKDDYTETVDEKVEVKRVHIRKRV